MKDEPTASASDPSARPARVSVALCTYNGARFVRAQLDSIAAQTRAVDEIVICDDGSADGTPEIVRAFAGAAPVPVRFEVNPQRLGVTKNFEKALSLCTGDVLFFCDQDDVWHPEKVARLLPSFDDPRVGLAFSNGTVVHEDLSPAGYTLWDSVWFSAGEQQRMRDGDALSILLRHAVAVGATLAMRAALRPLVLPIPDFPHSHDIWIALVSACVTRLAPVDEPLIRYRLHDANTVGLKSHNLLSQIKMARWQVRTNQFRINADMCQAALERLTGANGEGGRMKDEGKASAIDSKSFVANPASLSLLREKVSHYRARDAMPVFWPARLPVVARELAGGNYRKYSYGLKSVLQDLFLR